jgi:hypothetical protein
MKRFILFKDILRGSMPKISRILPKTNKKATGFYATTGNVFLVLDSSETRLRRIKCKPIATPHTYEFKNGKFDRMSYQFDTIKKALQVNSIYDMTNIDPILLNFTAGMYNIQFDVYDSLEGYVDNLYQTKLNTHNTHEEKVNG